MNPSRLLAVLLGLFVLAAIQPAVAGAGDRPAKPTVWLCKPGIADNPCLDGSLDGTSTSPTGTAPFSYQPARDPAFDCFYVYPTQSAQTTANANLARDEELKLVAINQASQFSRICDVYSPVYRQYTFAKPITNKVRDLAYSGVIAGFREYLARYNKGRSFVLIGHSQGASHLSRLLDEVVDREVGVRDRMISAIVPGSNNVYVPKGKSVGGNLAKIPACRIGDQIGCVMAWSIYLERATLGLPADATFGRLGTGYWVYPEKRPDPARYEVLCTNPAELSGDAGIMKPLANFPAVYGVSGVSEPLSAYPGFYRGDCRTGTDASWLDMSELPGLDSGLGSILNLIGTEDGGLHTGDVNLFLDNLIPLVSAQAAHHARWRKLDLRLEGLERQLAGARKASARAGGANPALKRQVASLEKKVKQAKAAAKAAYRPSGGSSTG